MIEINIITKKEADTIMKTEKEGDVQEAQNIMAVERKETKDIHLHRVPAVLAHVQSLDLGQSIRPIGGDLRYKRTACTNLGYTILFTSFNVTNQGHFNFHSLLLLTSCNIRVRIFNNFPP